MTPEKPASRFVVSATAQIENLRAWAYLMLLCSVGRVIWVGMMGSEARAAVTLGQWARFFWTGCRFDVVAMTYLLSPLIVMASLLFFVPAGRVWFRTMSRVWVYGLTILTPILAFANASYFQQFDDVFDEFLFDFFEGNAADVTQAAVSEHGLISKTIASLMVAAIAIWLHRRYFSQPIVLPSLWQQRMRRHKVQASLMVGLVAVVGWGLRGRLVDRPLQRVDASISSHRALNLGTLNPFYNLKTAYKQHRSTRDFLAPDRIIPDAKLAVQLACVADSLALSTTGEEAGLKHLAGAAGATFANPLWQRTAAGSPNVRPSHVFVLFMESYDSWPFVKPYRQLGLVEEGRQLAAEGHLLLNHVAGANASVRSSLVCLQGLYETNRGRQQCLPTSMVFAMKQLGYRTRSINSFASEWCETERIAREQGFDEVYCTRQIKPGGDTSNSQVHDRTLFEYAANQLSYDRPTMNFIRSSSYHPPWEVDLHQEHCTVGPFPEQLRLPGMSDEDNLRIAYGHLKYSDKLMTEFVRRMSARFPDALFVITGDHYGRHFLTPDLPVYEGCSVPLILYGPRVLAGTSIPDNMAASHVDMTTTLIELCAPAGYSYVSLGKNVLAECEHPVGVGTDYVMFSDCVVCLRPPERCVRQPWSDLPPLSETEAAEKIATARRVYEAFHGVGYMLARGALERPAEQIEQIAEQIAEQSTVKRR